MPARRCAALRRATLGCAGVHCVQRWHRRVADAGQPRDTHLQRPRWTRRPDDRCRRPSSARSTSARLSPWRVISTPVKSATGGVRVRVMPGPQHDYFPPEAIEVLQRTRFTVTSQSDRMGYRLTGATIPRVEDREMISDATFAGALQVPPSGDPILLMADRQTSGGYPQIATVITADLPHGRPARARRLDRIRDLHAPRRQCRR